MGLLRKSWKIGSLSLAIWLTLSNTAAAKTIRAENIRVKITGAPEHNIAAEKQGETVIYEENLGEYTVCEGDSLWRIADEFLGSGFSYTQIVEDNAQIITNPDKIYPDMRLQLKRKISVRRPTSKEEIRTQEYSFWMPSTWALGISDSGDAFANFALLGEGIRHTVCLIRDKEPTSVQALSDWEQCKKTITAYVKENFADRVFDLTFTQYQSQEGTKLYMFSYRYLVDGSKYGIQESMDIYVSEAICQTEHIQAEFTGFDDQEYFRDIVFRVAASFGELEIPENKEFTVNNTNMTISPSEPWAVLGIHNSFVWIDTYFDGMLQKIADKQGLVQKNAKERILREGD